MPTKEQLERALRNAHAAGDNAAAQRFAAELKKQAGPAREETVRQEFNDLPLWQKPIQALDDILRVGSDALTFGGTDYLRMMAGTQPDIETARQETKDARTRSGSAGDAAAVGASLIPAMALPVVTAPATMGPVMRGAANTGLAALEGAGFAGLDALGHGEDVADAQIGGALMGAGGSAVAGILGRGADMVASRYFNKQSPRMTPQDLRLESRRAYDEMKEEGIGFRPTAVDELVTGINKASKDAWPGLNDKAIAGRKRANKNLKSGGQGFGRTRTLDEIDLERQNLRNDVAANPDRSEARQGRKMVKALDTWLDDAITDPTKMTAGSGNVEEAINKLTRGRELSGRAEKLDMLDERLGRARRQSERNLYSGEDSTIKQNIGGILDDPRKRRMFNEDEIAQMEIVNKGTGTQRTLRQAGRMAPGGGLAWPAAAAGGTLGFSLGMPIIGAAIPPAVGVLAKTLSSRATRKEAEKLMDMVASGKTLKVPPTLSAKSQRELTRLLTMMGVTSEAD